MRKPSVSTGSLIGDSPTNNPGSAAGTHLLVDFWDARHLDDMERGDRALRAAVTAAGATLLHIHLHHFASSGGYSGVAVLAESHISIHTWPERGYAALDIFMCGGCDPQLALAPLKTVFRPRRVILRTYLRGVATTA